MKLFPEAWLLYKNQSGRVRTPASAQSHKYVLQRLQADHPKKHISRFTEDDLVRFCIGDGIGGQTQKHRRSICRSVFGWLKANRFIQSNPAESLQYLVSPSNSERRPGRWYDAEVAAEVIRACPDDFKGRRDRLALMFGFMLGLRVSTISGLRWSQFSPDFEQMYVFVKGNKPTTKTIPAQIRSELSDWALEKPESAVALIPALRCQGIGLREQVVLWDQPLSTNGIRTAVGAAGARVGIKLSPHDMRRTYAGILEERGKPVTDIQRALDHSDVGTTSRYLDRNPLKAAAVTGSFTLDI